MGNSNLIINERFMADLEKLLDSLANDTALQKQFEKEPMAVIFEAFGDQNQFIEKYGGKGADVNADSIKQIDDEIRSMVTRSKIGQVSPLAVTLVVASVAVYVVTAWAIRTWSPFSYSEHNLQLSEEKIRELLEKQIISREDLIQGGHKGV